MSGIYIKSFPALGGDAFLIKAGEKNIIIDLGYTKTYYESFKTEILKIKEKGEFIDLLVITHIDADHIAGGIAFLKDCNDFEFIKEVWFNSYRHLPFEEEKVDKVSYTQKVLMKSEFQRRKSIKSECSSVSLEQGITFSKVLTQKGYSKWNKSFDHGAVKIENKYNINLQDFRITLLSPNEEKLKKISSSWLDKLCLLNENAQLSDEEFFDETFEYYLENLSESESITFQESTLISNNSCEQDLELLAEKGKYSKDNSIVNGSSIAFILHYADKKMLFLGDAHDDLITDSLIKYQNEGNDLHFDLIKVSHHGSFNNNCRWIEITTGDRFLFSTDGVKHRTHPSIELIAKIITKNSDCKLYFNYQLSEIEMVLSNEKNQKKYKYHAFWGDGQNPLEIL